MAKVRTVAEVLRTGLEVHSGVAPLRYDTVDISWRELFDRVNRASRAWIDLGVRKGDPVLVMMTNTPDYVVAVLALGLIGAVQVPINTEYKGRMLRHVIADSGAFLIVASEEYIETIRTDGLEDARIPNEDPFATEARTLRIVDIVEFLKLELNSSNEPVDCDVQEHDPIGIMYTSGTTGNSKGVVITHRHAYEYAVAAAEVVELKSGDVYFAPLPLFHIGGQWAVVYASLITGATAVIKKRFSASSFWDDVAAEGATASFLLGAMAQFLASQVEGVADQENSLERVMMVPLLPETREFERRFGVRVSTCYGSTESNVPIAAGFSRESVDSAGRPRPGFSVLVVDEDDNEVEIGEVGELLVRPPEPWMTMVEYHRNSDATQRALRNLWLHTGDAFRQSEDGEFHFVDRLKDVIRRRGENISSFEVEREVNSHPDVLESAAVPVPSKYGEDEIRVFVVVRTGSELKINELRQFLDSVLPRFMVPEYIDVIDALPKTPTAKVQKHLLRNLPLSRDLR